MSYTFFVSLSLYFHSMFHQHTHTSFALHSIIAIHGLNGDKFRTWSEPKSQKLWLRDFLPKELPRARVMSFGYNATAAFENSKSGIEEHARHLLVSLMEKRDYDSVSLSFMCLLILSDALNTRTTSQYLAVPMK